MGLFGPSRPATEAADRITQQIARERAERQAADEKRRAEPRRPKDKLSNTKRTR
jgi:hypothetical protein